MNHCQNCGLKTILPLHRVRLVAADGMTIDVCDRCVGWHKERGARVTDALRRAKRRYKEWQRSRA